MIDPEDIAFDDITSVDKLDAVIFYRDDGSDELPNETYIFQDAGNGVLRLTHSYRESPDLRAVRAMGVTTW